jgi:hypothetical protein
VTARPLAFMFDAVGWEPPKSPPSMDACGAGRSTACCKFLIFGVGGIECARFTDLHPTLVSKDMGSQFVPETADCQAERALADEGSTR